MKADVLLAGVVLGLMLMLALALPVAASDYTIEIFERERR